MVHDHDMLPKTLRLRRSTDTDFFTIPEPASRTFPLGSGDVSVAHEVLPSSSDSLQVAACRASEGEGITPEDKARNADSKCIQCPRSKEAPPARQKGDFHGTLLCALHSLEASATNQGPGGSQPSGACPGCLLGTSGVTLRKRHRCSACPVLFANFGRAPAKTSHAMFKASAQQQAVGKKGEKAGNMALLPISSSLYALFVPPHFRHFPFSLSHLCRICPLCSGQGKGKHIEEGEHPQGNSKKGRGKAKEKQEADANGWVWSAEHGWSNDKWWDWSWNGHGWSENGDGWENGKQAGDWSGDAAQNAPHKDKGEKVTAVQ
ncbi:Slc47a1, partial [Symbiodinium necroappetens]